MPMRAVQKLHEEKVIAAQRTEAATGANPKDARSLPRVQQAGALRTVAVRAAPKKGAPNRQLVENSASRTEAAKGALSW